MVYILLSGLIVYTLFPCFPRTLVYTIAFLVCDIAKPCNPGRPLQESPRESPGAFRPRGRKSVRNSLKNSLRSLKGETVLRLRSSDHEILIPHPQTQISLVSAKWPCRGVMSIFLLDFWVEFWKVSFGS